MAFWPKKKIFLFIFIIPIVLIIGILIGFKLYFTSERLKALIIPPLENATGKSLEIKDISLSIFPILDISIEGLMIYNHSKDIFERSELLSVDKLVLDVKVLPLLRKNLEINEIIVKKPQIYLEVNSDGISNYALPKKESVPTTVDSIQAKVDLSKAGSLLLSNFEILDGKIEYRNKKEGILLIVDGYKQITSVKVLPHEDNISLTSSITIDQLSYGTIKSFYFKNQPINVNATLSYKISADMLSFDSVLVKIRELPLAFSGTVYGLQSESKLVDMKLSAEQVQFVQVLSLIPPDLLKMSEGLTSTGKVQFSVSLKGEMSDTLIPGVHGIFKIEDATIRYASLPKSISNINIDGKFEKLSAHPEKKGGGEFNINKFSARLGANHIDGKLSILNFDEPTISASFQGVVNLNEVGEYYPLEKGTEISGTMKADLSIQGKAKDPKKLKANGTLQFLDVKVVTATAKNPIRSLNGSLVFNNQIVETKQLSMLVGESDMRLSFVLKNFLGLLDEEFSTGKPYASITLASRQFRTIDIIDESKPDEKEKESNQPEKSVSLLPGIDVDVNVNVEKFITEKFTFENAQGSLSISNGIIRMRNFTLNAFEGKILTRGELNLQNFQNRSFNLNLDIAGVQAHNLLPYFTSFGNYLWGKLTLNADMVGELDDTLGLKTQSLRGKGSVKIFDGKLEGFPLTLKLAEVTGINELRGVNFKDWSNKFEISDGRIKISDLQINTGSTDFLLNGSQGLDGTLDYQLSTRLSSALSDKLRMEGISAQILQFFKDKDGRISLTFDVLGTSNKPSLRLNTKAQEEAAKQAAEQKKQEIIDEAKKRLEEEAKKKGIDGLKKLLKPPKR